MQPLQICIGPIIRIGRESWCLPYAGFLLEKMYEFSLAGSAGVRARVLVHIWEYQHSISCYGRRELGAQHPSISHPNRQTVLLYLTRFQIIPGHRSEQNSPNWVLLVWNNIRSLADDLRNSAKVVNALLWLVITIQRSGFLTLCFTPTQPCEPDWGFC